MAVRKILIGLAVLVILAVGAVFAAPLLLDAEAQKPRIQALVEEATGHRLAIAGGLSFSLLPTPAIDAEDVTIAGADESGPPLMTLKRLSLRLALPSLFRGVIEITEVRLDSPVVTVGPELSKPDPGAAPAADDGTAPPAAPGGGFDVAVRNAVIENGTVIIPGADGTETRIDKIEAQLSADGLNGPFKLSGGAATGGLPVTLDAAVGRLDGPQLPVDLTLAIAGASVRLSGAAGPPGAGPPRFKGRLALGVDDPSAMASLTGLAPPPGQAFSLAGDLVVDGSRIAMDNMDVTAGEARGTGTLKIETGDRPSGMLTLRVPRLVLQGPVGGDAGDAADDTKPVAAVGPKPFSLPGGVSFTVDLAIDALQINGGVVQKVAVIGALDDGRISLSAASAQLPGATDVSLSGTLSGGDTGPRFAGRLDVVADNLRALMDWLHVTPAGVPAERLTRLAMTGDIDVAGTTVAMTGLKGRLDGMSLTGSARYSAGPPVDLVLNLAVDRLDLDAYMPRGAKTGGKSGGPAAAAPPGNLHVAATVKVGSLRYQGLDLKSVDIDAALGGSTITINKASVADMAGAALSAKGVVGLAKGAADADLRMTATAPTIAPLATLAGLALPLDPAKLGAVSIDLGLKGSAEAPRLDGTIGLGGTRITVAGTTGPLTGTPSLDLAGKLTAPDLVGLGRQLGLDGKGAAGPVDLNYSLKGPTNALALEVNGPLGPLAAVLSFATTDGGWRSAARLNGDQGAAVLSRLGLAGPMEGPLSLDIEANQAGGVITLSKGAARIGPSTVQAAGTLGKGRFDGSVSADVVDLAAFRGTPAPPAAAAPAGVPAAPATNRWSTTPFDLATLRGYDGTLALKLGRLVNGTLEVTDLNAKVTAAAGKVTVSGLTGGLNPGNLRGSLTLDGAGQELGLAADLTLTGADLDKVTGRAPAGMGLSGLGDVTIDLTGRGKSQLALVSSLSGAITVAAQNGKIHGIDLQRLSDGLKSVNQAGDLINRTLLSVLGGTTAYRRLAAGIGVAKGVATVTSFESDVDGGVIDLSGGADLPAWTIRARAALKLNEPADMPPLGVVLSGPLDAPATTLDSGAVERYYLAKFLGKQVPGLGTVLGFPGAQPQKAVPEAAPTEAPASETPATEAAPTAEDQPEEEPAKPKKTRKKLLDGLLKGLGN